LLYITDRGYKEMFGMYAVSHNGPPGYRAIYMNKAAGAVTLETLVSSAILFLLVVIGSAILLKQSRYDAQLFTVTASQTGTTVSSEGEKAGGTGVSAPASRITGEFGLPSYAPEGFQPAGTQEVFGPDALSNKIDGKAELYLECGFVNLTTQRFASRKNSRDWFEVSVFDMGNPRNAFAMYGVQRRADTTDASFADFAYSTGNALFFLHGKYYVEVISSREDRGLFEAMTVLSKRFVKSAPGGAVEMKEITVLPREGLNRGTIKFFLTNAFSYDKFDHLLAAQYSTGAATTTVFVTVRDSAAEAATLADGYYNFLMGIGS